jgi:hypothetical protein
VGASAAEAASPAADNASPTAEAVSPGAWPGGSREIVCSAETTSSAVSPGWGELARPEGPEGTGPGAGDFGAGDFGGDDADSAVGS